MIIELKTQSAKRKVKTQNFKFLVLSLSFALYVLRFALCHAQPLSSSELIQNAKEYDGKTVSYEGEVIADIMRRGDYAWINVKDGSGAIGIWIHHSLLKDVAHSGSYKAQGDTVEITGIFRRACPEHGGDLDIHAEALRVTRGGRMITQRLDTDKRNAAAVLLGVLCLIWILTLFTRR